jgi:Tfp pilus assembly protein PilX
MGGRMTLKFKATQSSLRLQGGISLIFALFALVALSFAAIALVRSVDTTNVISGNIAFRQAALNATDAGVESAMTALATITTSSLDTNYPSGCAVGACNYYPTLQVINASGVPTVIDWTQVPSSSLNGNYAVQYVIDRLCNGPVPVTNVTANCMYSVQTTAGSQKSGAQIFNSADQLYYRVTVRVVGPSGTTSLIQSLFLY